MSGGAVSLAEGGGRARRAGPAASTKNHSYPQLNGELNINFT